MTKAQTDGRHVYEKDLNSTFGAGIEATLLNIYLHNYL